MTAVVSHGEVPPVEGRALNPLSHPLQGRGSHVAAYGVSRPEHSHRRIEFPAVDSQTAALGGIGPGAVVVGGTYNQRGHVALGRNELGCQTVEQLHLLHGIGALSGNVVEEDGEGPDSQVVHHLELGDQIAVVLLVPLDVLTGMHSPHEVHAVALTGPDQLGNVAGLVLGIGLAPVR